MRRNRDRQAEEEGLHDLIGNGDAASKDVEELLARLEEGVRGDRRAFAASSLQEAKSEEASSLERLAHVERDLRNITRIYRRLLDERNDLAARASRLHKAIRAMEPALGEEAHRDHGVELGRKGVVQYVADESWRMDNREDWDFEEPPPDEDLCPIDQVTQSWHPKLVRLVHDRSKAHDAG